MLVVMELAMCRGEEDKTVSTANAIHIRAENSSNSNPPFKQSAQAMNDTDLYLCEFWVFVNIHLHVPT